MSSSLRVYLVFGIRTTVSASVLFGVVPSYYTDFQVSTLRSDQVSGAWREPCGCHGCVVVISCNNYPEHGEGLGLRSHSIGADKASFSSGLELTIPLPRPPEYRMVTFGFTVHVPRSSTSCQLRNTSLVRGGGCAQNPSTDKEKAGGSGNQGHPCLHSKREASLGYVRTLSQKPEAN